MEDLLQKWIPSRSFADRVGTGRPPVSGEKQQQNVAGDGIRKQGITRLPFAAARGMRTVWNSQDGLDPDAPGW